MGLHFGVEIRRGCRQGFDVRTWDVADIPDGSADQRGNQRRGNGPPAPVERQRRGDPVPAEDALEQLVPKCQPAICTNPDDARQEQYLLDKRAGVIKQHLAPDHSPEKRQRLLLCARAPGQKRANVAEQSLVSACTGTKELVLQYAIELAGHAAAARQSPRDLLSEEGLTRRPGKNFPQRHAPVPGIFPETRCQSIRLVQAEVVQFNAAAINEWGDGGIRAKLPRRRHTQNNKVQPLQIGFRRAPAVTGADAAEQLLRKRKPDGSFDFVQENRDRFRGIGEHDFPEEFRKPLLARERALGLPPGLQVHLQPKFTQYPVGDTVGPTARFRPAGAFASHADLGQVHDGDQLALGAQVPDRTCHQAGLAAGLGSQDIAELPIANAAQQRLVGGSLHVAWPVRLNRTAYSEESACLRDPGQNSCS